MPLSLQKAGRIAIYGIVVGALAGCTTVDIPPPDTLLSEDQIIDLMRHPRRWYGQVVRVRLYPYDTGPDESVSEGGYLVCFEPCDLAYAERSSWILRTRLDRFKAYHGDRPAVVTARFESNCARLPAPGLGPGRYTDICPDFISGQFIEIE